MAPTSKMQENASGAPLGEGSGVAERGWFCDCLFSPAGAEDILARALFPSRHFRRALHLLNSSRLLRDLRFRFLAAKCLDELKGWHQCLMMLGDAKVDEHGNVLDQDDGNDIYFDKDAEDQEIDV